MMRFGPSGNSESFYSAGHKTSLEAPAWLHGLGLTAYEYSFGRGITLSEETAEKIGLEAKRYDLSVSVHAPYYINLANPDPEKRENTLRYITDSARMAKILGGDRVVVHVGAVMKMKREEALDRCREGLSEALKRLEALGLSDISLCPETMGRPSQIGDLPETLAFCREDARLIPCLDFAHIHALGGGCLRERKDFEAVLDTLEEAVGPERARHIHVHFSTIEYGKNGERRHRTFADADFGPRFEHLAPLFRERGYEARVICECRGSMAEDAAEMARLFAAEQQIERLP